MKRSTMVSILRQEFIRHMNCTVECCGSDIEMYSAILDALENHGMLPPLKFDEYLSGDHGWEKE